MLPTSIRLPVFATGLSLLFVFPAAAEFQISIYGGYQSANDSSTSVSGPTAPQTFNTQWEGRSFIPPVYWGVRGTYWLDAFAKPNWGIGVDFTHAKVYASSASETVAGWSHYEFSDGINLLTANALYRFQDEERRWTPYLGLGAGINIPYVEVTRPTGQTLSYQVGGPTVQALAGVDFALTNHVSVFTEYKGAFSHVDVSIDGGDRLKTNITTHALNLGISFNW